MKEPNTLPLEDKCGKQAKAPRGLRSCLNIPVLGHRDPRGPDNNIRIWVDANDRLHIRVEKTDRCYKFERVLNERGFVEVIAK